MNAGKLWWGQIGSSISLLSRLTKNICTGKSTILHLGSKLPWKYDFYDMVNFRRTETAEGRRLMRTSWMEGADPGEYVLKEFCSDTVIRRYWPGESYGAYLAGLPDLPLCDYIVWITGIRSKGDLHNWIRFVSEYETLGKSLSRRPVFVLESEEEAEESCALEQLPFQIAHHDCRVFCLEGAVALGNTKYPDYQAELALCLGDNNPELSHALLVAGEDLLLEPADTLRAILASETDCQGYPFPDMEDSRIRSALWKAALVLLFPIIEQYRFHIIDTYRLGIERELPIINPVEDRIDEPNDLEIGVLRHVANKKSLALPSEEKRNIQFCYEARNLMAHNKPVPYHLATALLALQSQT